MRALLNKRSIISFAVFGLLALFIFIIKVPRYITEPSNLSEPAWGITFSKKYATELGLDWKEAYDAILNDLNVDYIRIPVYWDDIEERRSSIDLTDYRYMLREAERHEVDVIVAIGERLPRWPECHIPAWAKALSPQEREQALFSMIEVVVKSLTEYQHISHWQVENEPLVEWFGICDAPDFEKVKREIEFVRTLDDKPIIVTDSGELSLWRAAARLEADVLGITTYRVIWNKYLKFIRYPFPPSFYRMKARLAGIPWSSVISVELQAEPWIPGTKGLVETSLEIQYRSMSLKQFRSNINYAKSLEVSQVYLWGAEWWYWLKIHNNDTIWNEAKKLWDTPDNSD